MLYISPQITHVHKCVFIKLCVTDKLNMWCVCIGEAVVLSLENDGLLCCPCHAAACFYTARSLEHYFAPVPGVRSKEGDHLSHRTACWKAKGRYHRSVCLGGSSFCYTQLLLLILISPPSGQAFPTLIGRRGNLLLDVALHPGSTFFL